MRITTAESLRKLRDESKQPSEIYAKILQVDYLNKQVQVQMGSRADWVQIVSSLDLGTRQNPKVIPGGEIQLVRWGGNEYVAAAYVAKNYLPMVGNGMSAAGAVAQPIDAPTFFSVIQRGTQLEATWSAVPGAAYYELYSNTVPGTNDVNLKQITPAAFVGTAYQWTLNATPSSNIITNNPGFESGDLTGWATSSPIWSVVNSIRKSGAYALRCRIPLGNTGYSDLLSISYPINQNANYTFSAYIYIPTMTAGGAFYLYSGGTSSELTISSTNSAFTLYSGTADTYDQTGLFLRFSPLITPSQELDLYIDDVSIVGPSSIQPTLLYAVRAVSAQGQPSPFTAWLQPTVQSAALGDPNVPHTEIDYANARVQSSNFIAQADANPNAGSHISPDGIDGNLLAASQRATLWHDESVVLVGNALVRAHDTAQNYGVFAYQNVAANGDSFEQKVFLRPGWYTFNALGITSADRAKVDWYLDNVLLLAGQDWYAGSGAYNVIKSSSVPFAVQYGGAHTLKAVVNGKNASSSGYVLALTKMWFAPASASEMAMYLKFNYPQYSSGLIHLGVL